MILDWASPFKHVNYHKQDKFIKKHEFIRPFSILLVKDFVTIFYLLIILIILYVVKIFY